MDAVALFERLKKDSVWSPSSTEGALICSEEMQYGKYSIVIQPLLGGGAVYFQIVFIDEPLSKNERKRIEPFIIDLLNAHPKPGNCLLGAQEVFYEYVWVLPSRGRKPTLDQLERDVEYVVDLLLAEAEECRGLINQLREGTLTAQMASTLKLGGEEMGTA